MALPWLGHIETKPEDFHKRLLEFDTQLKSLEKDTNDEEQLRCLYQSLNDQIESGYFELVEGLEYFLDRMDAFPRRFHRLMKKFQDNQIHSVMLRKIIGSLAKNKNWRIVLSTQVLMNSLISPMSVPEAFSQDHIAVLIQGLRAFGNICYMSDDGRYVLYTGEIVPKFKQFVEYIGNNPERLSFPPEFFTAMAGCVLNMFTDDRSCSKQVIENCHKELVEYNFLPTLAELMVPHVNQNHEMAYLFAMLVIILLENEIKLSSADPDHQFNHFGLREAHFFNLLQKMQPTVQNSSSIAELIHILVLYLNHPVEPEDRTDFLMNLFESEQLDEIAKETILEYFLKWIEEKQKAESMFEEGNGRLFKITLECLNSDNFEIQLYAVLLLGTFAQIRSQSEQMVRSGHHKILLKIMDLHTPENPEPLPIPPKINEDIRMQRACLNALRNLAIPAPNGEILRSESVLEQLLPYAFQASGSYADDWLETVRIMVKSKEDAVKLSADETFHKRLDHWASNPYVRQLRFQVARLIATMVEASGCVCQLNQGQTIRFWDRFTCLLASQLLSDRHRALKALNLAIACEFSIQSPSGNDWNSNDVQFKQLYSKLLRTFRDTLDFWLKGSLVDQTVASLLQALQVLHSCPLLQYLPIEDQNLIVTLIERAEQIEKQQLNSLAE